VNSLFSDELLLLVCSSRMLTQRWRSFGWWQEPGIQEYFSIPLVNIRKLSSGVD